MKNGYDKRIALRRQDLVHALGPDLLRDAELRLCSCCQFQSSFAVGLCSVDNLILPLTSSGEDCPYYLPRAIRRQLTQDT